MAVSVILALAQSMIACQYNWEWMYKYLLSQRIITGTRDEEKQIFHCGLRASVRKKA